MTFRYRREACVDVRNRSSEPARHHKTENNNGLRANQYNNLPNTEVSRNVRRSYRDGINTRVDIRIERGGVLHKLLVEVTISD